MADAIRKLTSLHDATGRFAKGNPGRPKGAKAKASRDLMAQIRAYGPHAATKLWQALETDQRWAIELVLRYCLPTARTIEFEDMDAADLREAIKAGDLSADEASRLTTALANLAEIESIDAIRERLDQLEEAVKNAR